MAYTAFGKCLAPNQILRRVIAGTQFIEADHMIGNLLQKQAQIDCNGISEEGCIYSTLKFHQFELNMF